MGFFAWLGGLLDQLIDWLGKVAKVFVEALVDGIQKLWKTAIASVLVVAFGFASILYVIFYAGQVLGETIMELWDPNNMNKPSEVFKLKQAPQNSPLPTKRNQAKVLEMTNIPY